LLPVDSVYLECYGFLPLKYTETCLPLRKVKLDMEETCTDLER